MYKDRLYEMEVRQGFRCAICERTAGSRMEFDHQDGRGMNGGHRSDEILDDKGGWINAALCHDCNTRKGSKRYQWIDGKYVPITKDSVSIGRLAEKSSFSNAMEELEKHWDREVA